MEIDRELLKLILDKLEQTQDEGPITGSGWQSKELITLQVKIKRILKD